MKKLLLLSLLFISIQSFSQDSLCTLPVKITSLKVNVDSRVAKIEWQTELEQNNDHYQVEKSLNGKTFTAIALVKPNEARDYYAFDELTGAAFYRIKQVDKEGYHSYSKIVYATKEISGIKVAPNPFKDELNVSLFVKTKSMYQITIRDFTGRKVSSKELFLSPGANFVKVNTDSLYSGIYLITITNAATILLNQKIIK